MRLQQYGVQHTNMLTRSKRIHEARNQGASPLVLLALLLFVLPSLLTLQKLVELLLLGDIEYNQWNYFFLSIYFTFFNSLFNTFLPDFTQLEYLLFISFKITNISSSTPLGILNNLFAKFNWLSNEFKFPLPIY